MSILGSLRVVEKYSLSTSDDMVRSGLANPSLLTGLIIYLEVCRLSECVCNVCACIYLIMGRGGEGRNE